MKTFLSFLTVTALVLALSASFITPAVAQENPETLFQAKCSKCHNLDRADVTMAPDEWWNTILKMKKKWFSGISEEDAKVIYQYLVQTRSK